MINDQVEAPDFSTFFQPRKATIRRRSAEEALLSDQTVTPKWLADFLYEERGAFDLDVCSNSRSHMHAHWSYGLEKGLDGLKLPWKGFIWCNGPYSKTLPWALKAVYELSIGRCTELMTLCKMDNSTDYWAMMTAEQPILHGCPDLWLFNERINFDEHPELIELRKREVAEGIRKGNKSGKSSNNFCSALIHHRSLETAPLRLERRATLWRRP